MKNSANPAQIIKTIESGGSLSLQPAITETDVGMVAPCMRTIPIQPPISANLFFIMDRVYTSAPGMSNRDRCKSLILNEKSAFFGCSNPLILNDIFFAFFKKKCGEKPFIINDLGRAAPMGLPP